MKFYCRKTEGKFTFDKEFKNYVGKIPNGLYCIEFDEIKRTTQQNRYYWLYLRIISQETGDNEQDLHEYFKRKLLPPRFVSVLGKEIKLPASTTRLNKKDFGDYIDRIQQLTDIPAPETNG
jgi:hypothetical protein